MNRSLTVVLPIHNAEASIRQSVDHVLEVAAELTDNFEVLVVDDGSTDDTFDVARELATRYPQLRVVRQAQRRGLGPTINSVRRLTKTDVVMVHDGVSTMNADQLRALWDHRGHDAQPSDVSMSDLLRPRQNQAAMAAAHRRVTGFQWLTPAAADEAPETPAPMMTASSAHGSAPKGVGGIPTLPQTGVLGAMSNFARNE
ncbi:MAG: glycosyltransferase family 2 protein [Planctomycetota bacterium]